VCAVGAEELDDSEEEDDDSYGTAPESSLEDSSSSYSSSHDSSALDEPDESTDVDDPDVDDPEVDVSEVLALVGAVIAMADASTAMDPALTPASTTRLVRKRRDRSLARRRRARAPGSRGCSAGSGVTRVASMRVRGPHPDVRPLRATSDLAWKR
jgi:hypothetical protein